MIQKFISIIVLVLFFSCSPTEIIKTGYLVTVENGENFSKKYVNTSQDADKFVYQKTGNFFLTDELIGEKYKYWDFSNDSIYIYVEKKAYTEKNKWKRLK